MISKIIGRDLLYMLRYCISNRLIAYQGCHKMGDGATHIYRYIRGYNLGDRFVPGRRHSVLEIRKPGLQSTE